MFAWLEALPISEWVATSDWGYPILLSIHSMGMAIVVGILVMLDVRVLGAARAIPIGFFERLIPYAWAGFVVNLISGTLLFMSMAHRLAVNWPFLSKIAAIVVAGLVSWLLWQSLRRDVAGTSVDHAIVEPQDGDAEGVAASLGFAASRRTKVLATLSIATWFTAILFGRLIAYVLDAAMLRGDI